MKRNTVRDNMNNIKSWEGREYEGLPPIAAHEEIL